MSEASTTSAELGEVSRLEQIVDREALGETVTRWVRENPNFEITNKIVTQSSDSEFHCLTITLFYRAAA